MCDDGREISKTLKRKENPMTTHDAPTDSSPLLREVSLSPE